MSDTKIKKRKSNIDLLKVLCMFGVIALHINNSFYGGAMEYAAKPWNAFILQSFEQLFYCSVDALIIISGYFLAKRTCVDFIKPSVLLLQVILVNEGWYFLLCAAGKLALSSSEVLTRLLPASYYAVLYAALYLFSPLINRAFSDLSRKTRKKAVLLVFLLLSVEPWLVDVLEACSGYTFAGLSFISMDGSGVGYTLVNFILCYIIGYWIRNDIDIGKMNTGRLFFAFVCVYAFLLACRLWIPMLCVEYCSPFVIVQAALTFCLFLKLEFTSKVINRLAGASFTVYLLNIMLIHLFVGVIHNAVAGNPFLMVVLLAGICTSIYIACYFVHLLYNFLVNRMIIDRIVSKFDLESKLNYDLERK